MKLVCCDFETLWSSKDYTLSKMGPIQYIRDGRFSAQLLGWRVNREPVQVCEHDDIPTVLASLHLDAPDTITVAHNGNGFDFLILSEIYGVIPSNTLDTIDMMRWCGLSSIISESHASLTAHFGTGVKRQGTVISDGKHWPQDFTPEEREAFKLYCMQDVEQCSENCFRMLPFITGDMLAFDTITSHMAMEPAIWADGDALREYDAALTAQTVKARSDLQHLFHFDTVEEFQKNIRSAQKFCVMLRQLGVEPPVKVSEAKSQTKKAEMEAQGLDTSDPESWTVYAPALSKQDREFVEMQEHPDERVSLLVRTRLENNSSIQQSRTRTFIRMADYHKPVPVMLKAFGAHTGRYAAGSTEGKGDGTNFQNLSKRNPAMLPLRQALKVPAGFKLVSCDSSQIEARCLAYIANQADMVDLFAHGEDVYADFGEVISGGIPAKEIHDGAKAGDKKLKKIRNNSKTIILGAGYGTSPAKASHTMWMQGQKQDEDYEKHAEIVKSYILMYRQKNTAITGLWKTCQQVIESLAAGGAGSFGGPAFNTIRYGMAEIPGYEVLVPSVIMPSGFALRYPNLHADVNESGKVEYKYTLRRGRNDMEHRLYGSSLTENIIQCIAFQLLQYQACRMREAGIKLICNIHDSFSTVVPEAQAEATADIMIRIMRTLPPWLPGCPIDAEAEITDDFTGA